MYVIIFACISIYRCVSLIHAASAARFAHVPCKCCVCALWFWLLRLFCVLVFQRSHKILQNSAHSHLSIKIDARQQYTKNDDDHINYENNKIASCAFWGEGMAISVFCPLGFFCLPVVSISIMSIWGWCTDQHNHRHSRKITQRRRRNILIIECNSI